MVLQNILIFSLNWIKSSKSRQCLRPENSINILCVRVYVPAVTKYQKYRCLLGKTCSDGLGHLTSRFAKFFRLVSKYLDLGPYRLDNCFTTIRSHGFLSNNNLFIGNAVVVIRTLKKDAFLHRWMWRSSKWICQRCKTVVVCLNNQNINPKWWNQ